MHYKSLSDQELVEQCQAAYPSVSPAFTTLVDRYKRQVFARVIKIVKHLQDTEDVSQEVFIRVYEALPRFRQESSFRTWILTIAANTSLTFIDRRRRRSWWWLQDDIDELQESRKEDKQLLAIVTESLENEDLREEIETVLQKLSPISRDILVLRYFNELDLQSLADTLNIKLSAAKMRLKRAREEFKKSLTRQSPDMMI